MIYPEIKLKTKFLKLNFYCLLCLLRNFPIYYIFLLAFNSYLIFYSFVQIQVFLQNFNLSFKMKYWRNSLFSQQIPNLKTCQTYWFTLPPNSKAILGLFDVFAIPLYNDDLINSNIKYLIRKTKFQLEMLQVCGGF